jgi:xylose isomerase
MVSDYHPRKEDHFTFGLWTVGNTGRDPFGSETRPAIKPVESVKRLSELNVNGVNLHATPPERDRIVGEFKKALSDHDMKVPMATTNLFSDPVFKDKAFASTINKVRTAIDHLAALSAEIDVSKNNEEGIKRFRENINFLCVTSYAKYDTKFTLEATPNESQGDTHFSAISTIAHTETISLNSEFANAPLVIPAVVEVFASKPETQSTWIYQDRSALGQTFRAMVFRPSKPARPQTHCKTRLPQRHSARQIKGAVGSF